MLYMLHLPLLVLLLGLCMGSTVARAEMPTVVLSSAQLQQPVDVNASLLLEDPSANLTAAEVLQLIERQGQPVTGMPRMGYSDSAWWMAFRLDAPAAKRLDLIIDRPSLDDIEVWLYDRERLIAPFYSGDHRPFLERGLPSPHFMLGLPRLGQGPHTVLLRVQSGSALSLPVQLVAAEQSDRLLAEHWLRSGLLLGALFSLALFFLVRFSALRELQLVWFCLTVAHIALYNASIHGLTSLLFTQWTWLSAQLANLANPGILIFSSLFIASALKLELGRLRLLRNALFALILFVSAWTIVSYGDFRAYQALNLLILSTGLYQLLLLVLGVYQRKPYAIGYLLCWGVSLLLMLLVPLGRTGVIPLLPGFSYMYAYLPVLSMLIFGAILDKQLEQIRRALLQSKAQARGNLEQYQALFSSSGEGIFRCTRSGELIEANPSFVALLGPEGSSALSMQQLVGAARWAELVAQLHSARPAISQECQMQGADGQQHWVYLSLHVRSSQDCIEGIVVDLSERRALEERLQYLAAHDSLTGLLNRRELERLLSHSLSAQGTPCFSHLLSLDLDQFKQVNDLCGHSAGDHLLRQLASHMLHHLPQQAELARIGGDEFAVLLRGMQTATALEHAENLRRCVEQFVFSWQGRPFRVQASIGLLELSSAVSDWETALNWADSASQLAKLQGRNQVQQFNPDDGSALEHQRQLEWITRLREGIEHDHFELFYQPVKALKAGPDDGLRYEVLLRYRDPHSGEWVAPGQFLGAAERYGLLGAIDRWVVMHLLQWLADNPKHLEQLVQVNFNLTASSLLNPQFHDMLLSELQRLNLPAHKLCIEVTEMVALGELGVSAQWIQQLRSLGLKVALDDFGSGFASYAYLRHLPLDTVKIDGSFISGIEADPINQAMVGSMQQIASQLGLSTVAEFVESQATLDCLHQLGLDFAQGYFIGRPQPLSQLSD